MINEALNKALSGSLTVSLLFWRDLSGALVSWVFDTNLYDSCVMNNTADRKQCAILWHVDDLKISHMSSKMVDKVLSELTAKYGNVSELSVSGVRVYDYLGMRIDYGQKERYSSLCLKISSAS